MIGVNAHHKGNPGTGNSVFDFNDNDDIIYTRIRFIDRAAYDAFLKHPTLASVEANIVGKRKVRFSGVANW